MNQAQRLTALRQQAGLTQREVGQRVGVSHSRINTYEKNPAARLKLPVLQALAQLYDCTPEYILQGRQAPAVPSGGPAKDRRNGKLVGAAGGLSSPVVVTDALTARERVLFVPVRAQAGYPQYFQDPAFVGELPSYSLPGFTNGTYRIFEVEGESMYPLILPGDLAICGFVERFEAMRDGQVYVLVCREGVLIKRCVNAVKKRGAVIIESENPAYKPDVIMAADILEVWEYKARITRG